MVKEKEEMLLLREACFAVEQGAANGEECFYTAGELFRKYSDPNLHPVFQYAIRQTLENTCYNPTPDISFKR